MYTVIQLIDDGNIVLNVSMFAENRKGCSGKTMYLKIHFTVKKDSLKFPKFCQQYPDR